MKMLFACGMLAVLAACSEAQETPEPVAVTPVATAPAAPKLSPPDEAVFTTAFAEACPEAPEVSTALCKSLGFGEEGFTCNYGLGEDEYRRNTATLVPEDGVWTLDDPEKTCAAADAA
ncbi:hypothetical protein [Altericroceibacterium xinjiangense]|uniref:hypothetical protein n=1 Tax=Altericroceibacterium xinjiangense TaxID=762261 RepID=UPI000F7E6569|nr:hypothetical protein [Altericroceibacterium xinjiangense]